MDAGTYLGEIDFDGTDDDLDLPTDIISSINSVSTFLVSTADVTTGTQNPLTLSKIQLLQRRYFAGHITGGNFNLGYSNSSTAINMGVADTSTHLFSATSGATTTEAWLDGTSKGTVSSADQYAALSSGGIGAYNATGRFDGKIKEIIIYDSDQSANRTGIEANINGRYSIY